MDFERGIVHDTRFRDASNPKGHIKLPEEFEFVELEVGDEFWVWLAEEVTPAIPPDGSLPVPSEFTHVLEHGLGMWGIHHPENQALCNEVLRWYWSGRAEGMSTRFEKPGKPAGQPRKHVRRGGSRR